LYRLFITVLILFANVPAFSQQKDYVLQSFMMRDSVLVTIDRPSVFKKSKPTIIIFYALPNGNSTAWTMGKKMAPGDDWHFDIQHIAAQTRFIRQQSRKTNIIVIYLENNYKSWPRWKQVHTPFTTRIPHIIDSLSGIIPGRKKEIYLNGHSGGGSFIFGYLASFDKIPPVIKRISFLDSDYGYDSSYYPKLKQWLQETPRAALNVFAYNDSVALYNGKPVVSATGGTWWRSHLMLWHLQDDFPVSQVRNDSLVVYKSNDERIQFYFKTNPDRKIYHTQQVELNGFIHSILCGTKYESKNYSYYGTRAYTSLIE
jgi:hypothetical protein